MLSLVVLHLGDNRWLLQAAKPQAEGCMGCGFREAAFSGHNAANEYTKRMVYRRIHSMNAK